jgi:hypothetical protein
VEKKLDGTLREIADHLGFLGYESEVQEGKKNPYVYLRHLRNPNLVLDLFGGAVKCVAFYGLSEEGLKLPSEFLGLLLELNQRANVLKFYTDDDSLVLELVFPHEYSKTSFGAYWSCVESDFRLIDGRLGPFLK